MSYCFLKTSMLVALLSVAFATSSAYAEDPVNDPANPAAEAPVKTEPTAAPPIPKVTEEKPPVAEEPTTSRGLTTEPSVEPATESSPASPSDKPTPTTPAEPAKETASEPAPAAANPYVGMFADQTFKKELDGVFAEKLAPVQAEVSAVKADVAALRAELPGTITREAAKVVPGLVTAALENQIPGHVKSAVAEALPAERANLAQAVRNEVVPAFVQKLKDEREVASKATTQPANPGTVAPPAAQTVAAPAPAKVVQPAQQPAVRYSSSDPAKFQATDGKWYYRHSDGRYWAFPQGQAQNAQTTPTQSIPVNSAPAVNATADFANPAPYYGTTQMFQPKYQTCRPGQACYRGN